MITKLDREGPKGGKEKKLKHTLCFTLPALAIMHCVSSDIIIVPSNTTHYMLLAFGCGKNHLFSNVIVCDVQIVYTLLLLV